MTTIVIVEGNTPEVIATGDSAAAGFVRTFLALAPTVELRVVAPYAGALPESAFDGADGAVFTGSGVAWSTEAPEIAPQVGAIEAAFDAELPVWGSCNGMQLAAVVLGGTVDASPHGLEVGLAREVTINDEGAGHPMMANRDDVFAVPTVHRDEVQRVPDGAVVLAGNAHCPVQAMVYERGGISFWGTQYHPELTTADVAAYIRAPGIFTEKIALVDDLTVAHHDESAATRLGGNLEGLRVESRARELVNWLKHIEAR